MQSDNSHQDSLYWLLLYRFCYIIVLMSDYESDPRSQWSRKVQDFHSSDPAVQAALEGKRYFPVTPGHLLSTALETGYFTDVDDCMNFFGLDRGALQITEPFNREEIDRLEGHILADADTRLRPAADATYIRWAGRLIDEVSGDNIAVDRIINTLKGRLAPELSEGAQNDAQRIADETYDSDFNACAYDERHLQLQVARAVELLERDGFAITLDTAMRSLEANGFTSSKNTADHFDKTYPELQAKLAQVAYYGVAIEFEDGIWSLEDFSFEENYIKDGVLENAYGSYREGLPIVLSAKDLLVFAQTYASPDKLPAIAQDRKAQVLTALIKNTDERIMQLRQITPNIGQVV